ncbi:MAG TPA: helix-turn-helix transcriptional regulator [Thermoanaerobaculia bacterium]|jgi:transcriptional regulator with XRE-family HTH domain|nr:helix-turn-helix transcriptional regulator [Thermoanaerobaculia bacterium]
MATLHTLRPPRRGFAVLVGSRIKELRGLRGFQQREMASRANLAQDALSKYESGTHTPSLKRAYAIARGLALPVDLLLPALDFQEPDDRELYGLFRRIWLQPLPVRAMAARTLKLSLELLGSPADLPAGERHASRR